MDFSRIREGLNEIRFIRSAKDAEGYYHKIAFLLPRMFGFQYQHTAVPASLQIEPTNCCNIRCICCPVSRCTRKKGFMEFDLFKKIIDDAFEIGVKRIHLYLHGEPLLHPQSMEMIRYIKTKGLSFNLVSNGMMFDEDNMREFLDTGADLGDHVVFSILGYSKHIHETIMTGIDHDRVVRNLISLIEHRGKRKKHAPVVEVIFYAMPENEQEKIRFKKFWSGKADHVRIIPRISESFRNYKMQDTSAVVHQRRCPNIWERMAIFWNGDVSLCCEDVDGDYILGNLQSKSIRDVWNGEKMLVFKRLHQQYEQHKHPLCSKCDM